MQSRLLLDIVITQSATIFELFARKNQALLIGGDSAIKFSKKAIVKSHKGKLNDNLPFLVLNFGLDIVDGVRRLHLQGNSFTR